MREITIGDAKVRVRGTPLALLYYKQEFKSDLVGDLSKMGAIGSGSKGKKRELELEKLDTVIILQVTWAMAKADAGPGAQFPPFMAWLGEIAEFDLGAPEFLGAVMEEVVDGFFRGQRGRG
jgi:hypothetical protein